MAKLPIDYHPEARLEIDVAFDWYRERSTRAADRFYLELEKAHTAIQSFPETWAEYLYSTRRYRLKRYPYVVVYRVAEHRIEVIAVAHGRRKPGIGGTDSSLPNRRQARMSFTTCPCTSVSR